MLDLFVRQPFTQSGEEERVVVQGALDVVLGLDGKPYALNLLTGKTAETEDTFRGTFEQETGLAFNPRNFRQHRLRLIDQAQAMVIIRANLSESGAFEIAYNIFSGKKAPMFFAIWEKAAIKTTLLRDLGDLCDAEYHTFSDPNDLQKPLAAFFQRLK